MLFDPYEWAERTQVILDQDQLCSRCGEVFHAISWRKLCHGCVALIRYDKVCCERARYVVVRPGDPCGFRRCPVHGSVSVEPVD